MNLRIFDCDDLFATFGTSFIPFLSLPELRCLALLIDYILGITTSTIRLVPVAVETGGVTPRTTCDLCPPPVLRWLPYYNSVSQQ